MIYHTNITGPGKEGFLQGFIKALELAEQEGTNQVLFSVHTLSNFDEIIKDSLGDDFFKRFRRDRESLYEGITVFLETAATKSDFSQGVAFTPFISTERLAGILADVRVMDIVYVPWALADLSSHQQAHAGSLQF